jgi:acetyl-CoA carboxylase biotin carboxyl carrier protein
MAQKRIASEVAGKVWKVEVQAGAKVAQEDTLLILESMKMEIPVAAPSAGTVVSILVAEGDLVAEGQHVAVLDA